MLFDLKIIQAFLILTGVTLSVKRYVYDFGSHGRIISDGQQAARLWVTAEFHCPSNSGFTELVSLRMQGVISGN
jgi:hypothetical protein